MKKLETGIPRISKKEMLILGLLINSKTGKLFGLEMIDGSNGKLKRGTVYVTLYRMEEKGLISSQAEARSAPEVGIARRYYCVTGLGEKAYRTKQALDRVSLDRLAVVQS